MPIVNYDNVPTCPRCRGSLRSRTDYPGSRKVLICDIHGKVKPVWIDETRERAAERAAEASVASDD